MPIVSGLLISAGIGAAAGVVGDITSSSTQASTNEANAQQAALNRQFQAQQAQQQEQFQTSSQQEAQSWMAQMSNTAMQRRVTDLEQAGLNPLLAIGQGGASTPGSGAMPGAAGSGAQATFQNPGASFQNLGNQVTSAMQAGASIDLAKAQTAKTVSETPTETGKPTVDPDTGELTVRDATHALGNATVENIAANTGVSVNTAQQVKANTDLLKKLALQADSQTAVNTATSYLTNQRADILQATKSSLIQQATAGGTEAVNVNQLLKSPFWGPIVTILDRLIKPASSAIGAMQ